MTIYYISDDNNSEINKTKDIKLNFNIDNSAHIYIGCDIIKEKVVNAFNGCIGTIFLLNNKKLSQKSYENIDLILKLKGDYAKSILMAIEYEGVLEDKKNIIIKESIFNFKDNNQNIIKKLIEIYNKNKLKLSDSIQIIISPCDFKLIQFKDNMNCMFYYKDKEFDERSTKYIEVRQNYFNIKNKSLKKEKKIKIYCTKFNSAFNIFRHKNSLEEFIKYDGIIYFVYY